MIAKEDLDALEELKATQESLASSTEMELKKLQSRHKDLQIDYDQQKSQLIEALLSKDKLQQLVIENRTKNESKADESTETNQMKDSLEKTSSDLKASQEVSHIATSQASEELAREQALFGYGPPIKISLRPEEVVLPDSPTFLNDDGQVLLVSRPVLNLESMSSSRSGVDSTKQDRSADISSSRSASPWKFWTKRSRSPAINSVSLKLDSLPPQFSGFSLSIPQKELVDYTRKLTDDITATPKTG